MFKTFFDFFALQVDICTISFAQHLLFISTEMVYLQVLLDCCMLLIRFESDLGSYGVCQIFALFLSLEVTTPSIYVERGTKAVAFFHSIRV